MRVYALDRDLTPEPAALNLWIERQAQGGVIVMSHRAEKKTPGGRTKPSAHIVSAHRIENADALEPIGDNQSSGDRQGIGMATSYAKDGGLHSMSVLLMRDDDAKAFYETFIRGR